MSVEATQTEVPHSRYTPTSRACRDTQQDVTDAFIAGEYPIHTDGELYSSENFKAYQKTDGSGRIRHYATVETVRTRTGLIITNSQCWGGGFAHCSPPHTADRDATLPLHLIRRIVRTRGYRQYDIQGVTETTDGTLVDFPEGQVYIGTDDTQHDSSTRFAFYVEDPVDDPAEALALLRPDGISDSAKRQGEWFFDPVEIEAQNPILKGLSYTDTEWDVSHTPIRAITGVDKISYGSPPEGSEIHPEQPIAKLPDGTRVLYRRVDKQDFISMEYKNTMYRQLNRMGSHEARDLLFQDGKLYVRGTVRHKRNEHRVLNLGETWHRAKTHNYTVMTGDTSRGTGGGYD